MLGGYCGGRGKVGCRWSGVSGFMRWRYGERKEGGARSGKVRRSVEEGR